MKKKILALCLIIALAATAAIGGSLAYFTDTKEATNTFTVGKLSIKLEEPTWESTGKAKAEKVVPGDKIEKDPTVIVEKGSVDCYVRMTVTMPDYIFDSSNFYSSVNQNPLIKFDGISLDFQLVGTPTSVNGLYTLVLKHVGKITGVEKDKDCSLGALFTSVTFDKSIDSNSELYKKMAYDSYDWNIDIKAYAVQADNMADEATAFAEAFPGVF